MKARLFKICIWPTLMLCLLISPRSAAAPESPAGPDNGTRPADYLGNAVFVESVAIRAGAGSWVDLYSQTVYQGQETRIWTRGKSWDLGGNPQSTEVEYINTLNMPGLLSIPGMPAVTSIPAVGTWQSGIREEEPTQEPIPGEPLKNAYAEMAESNNGSPNNKGKRWSITSQKLRLRSENPLSVDIEKHFIITTWATPLTNIGVSTATHAGYHESQIESEVVVTLTLPAGQLVSAEFVVPIAGTSNYGRWVEVRPFSMDVLTDLNNDGTISDHDKEFVGKPYEDGATEEEIASGTEYMFINDQMSNGASDGEDTSIEHETEDDDDAEAIRVTCGSNRGTIWLEHPAIQALTFYSGKECSPEQEIDIKEEEPFDLAGESPLPATIYVRCDGTIVFDEDDPQFSGDLVLKFKTLGGEGVAFEKSSKLSIVEDIGATHFFQAAKDYILEKNCTHLARNFKKNTSAYYVIMLQSHTMIYGINARVHDAQGIEVVALVRPEHTVIINCSYAEDPSPTYEGGDGFYKRHIGELYRGGDWDTTCSRKTLGWPAGALCISSSVSSNPANPPYGVNYDITFGNGDVPGNALEGSGGFHPLPGNVGPTWTSMGQATLANGSSLIAVACGSSATAEHGTFTKGLAAGTATHKFLQCDGGASIALAVTDPTGQLKILKKGARHFLATGVDYRGQCLKAYLGFTCIKPREEAP